MPQYHISPVTQRMLNYLDRADPRARRVPHTILHQLLNSMADCYQTLGDVDKAVGLFSRSLELDPDQDLVKERLTVLKNGSEGAPR